MAVPGPDNEDLGTTEDFPVLKKGGIFPGGLGTFSSFRYPAFRAYYAALLGQTAARSILSITRALLIYRLTGSATILASMALVSAIPGITLSLFGGVLADRMPKRQILIAGQCGSIVASLAVGLALSSGIISAANEMSWLIIIGVTLFQSTILSMVVPARHAIIPELVGEKHIMNAVALNNMGRNVLRLTAPVLAGFLIDTIDFEPVFYLIAALYLIALIATFFLPVLKAVKVKHHDTMAEMKDGLKYIFRERNLLLVLGFTAMAAFFTMSHHQLLPIFTEDILKVGATEMGLLIGVSAGGAIAASLILASLPNKKRGIMLVSGGLVLALSLIVFAFSENWYLSLGAMVIAGLAMTVRSTMSNTLIQYYAAENYRGRVMSVYMMEIGLISLGVFVAGLLSEFVGIQWAIGGLAMVFAVFSAVMMCASRRARRLE